MIQVEIKGKRGKPSTHVTEDEEFRKVNFEKFSKLGTVFQKDGGTVTAGDNISVLKSFQNLEQFSRRTEELLLQVIIYLF